ncbi:MAG: phosphoglycerate mutase family protein [Bifidobacteriaceae bacterium]|jgi:broad specificity phosphatase PhoE|nr:phosphoglycerate mutase family protein [Bifidobacteriaceae bacterium]
MSNDITTFHFVRHAEVYNPNKVIYEHLDGYFISKKGHRQAEKLAEFLQQRQNWLEKFSTYTLPLSNNLYSSPLLRAQETATPIIAKLNLKMIKNTKIIEAKSAIAGKPIPKNPWQLAYLIRNPFLPSWGEPYKSILQRFLAFFNEIGQKEAGKQVICISHQSPIWVLHRYFNGKKLWHNPTKRQPANCSITSFVYNWQTKTVEIPVKYIAPAINI